VCNGWESSNLATLSQSDDDDDHHHHHHDHYYDNYRYC
jgi:hypothetical protein